MASNVIVSDIIPERVPFIDPRTGLIARPWFLFLLNLFKRLDANIDPLTLLGTAPASTGEDGGIVTSVSNADGTLTISPTIGDVIASIALGHANTWTAPQTVSLSVNGFGLSTLNDSPTGSSGFSASYTGVGTGPTASAIYAVYNANGQIGNLAGHGALYSNPGTPFTAGQLVLQSYFAAGSLIGTWGSGAPLKFGAGDGTITMTEFARMTSSGLWGFGTTTPGLNATVGRNYVTIKGLGTGATAAAGVMQLVDNCATDAAGNTLGNVEWHNSTNTSGNTRCGYVSMTTEGATANSRGAFMSMATRVNNSAAATERLRIDAPGNVVLGGSGAALATTATDGFAYVPSCAGPPTGVPTAYTGRIPLVVDSTNNKMYIYSGGAWVALN